jgi:hypothetical protein
MSHDLTTTAQQLHAHPVDHFAEHRERLRRGHEETFAHTAAILADIRRMVEEGRAATDAAADEVRARWQLIKSMPRAQAPTVAPQQSPRQAQPVAAQPPLDLSGVQETLAAIERGIGELRALQAAPIEVLRNEEGKIIGSKRALPQ